MTLVTPELERALRKCETAAKEAVRRECMQTLTQRNARAAPTRTTNDRYTFRTWLLRLGMIGPEFETARFHLLSHLEGNIAWRDPSQLIREQEEQTQHAPAQEPVPAPGLSL